MSGIVIFFCYYINTMAHKKFIYKPSVVDQLIMFIILIACAAFAGLIYLDYSNKLPTDNGTNNSSAEVQQLQQAERELRAELERIRNEGASDE